MRKLLKSLLLLIIAITLFNCNNDKANDLSYLNYFSSLSQAENDEITWPELNQETPTGSVDLDFVILFKDIILPDIDMEPAVYEISGSSASGAGFNISTNQLEVLDLELEAGEWEITVSAINGDGIIIYQGIATIIVYDGQTIELTIEITPIEGYGILELTGTWDADDITDPSIESYIIPYQGSAINLDFAITGGNTATCIANNIPSGYYTLVLKLFDGAAMVSSFVNVVRIIDGETTSKTFQFIISGSVVDIKITPDTNEPIEVSMSGKLNSMNVFEVMELIASVPDDEEEVIFRWYLDGEQVSTESGCILRYLGGGRHIIVVTAFTKDGKRAGSEIHSFIVFESDNLNSAAISWDNEYKQVVFTWATENLNPELEYWVYPYMSFDCCDEPFGSAPEYEAELLEDMYFLAIDQYRPAIDGTGAWDWNDIKPDEPSGQLILLAYNSLTGDAFVADIEEINTANWSPEIPAGDITNVSIEWQVSPYAVSFTWTVSNLNSDYEYWVYPYMNFTDELNPFGTTPEDEAYLLAEMYDMAIENYRPASDENGSWEWTEAKPADPAGQLALLAYDPANSDAFVVDLQNIETAIWKEAKDIVSFIFRAADNNDLDFDVIAEINGANVNIDVPDYVNVTGLIPSILITGDTVNPLSGVAADFTNPVTYTVTAENDSTRDYSATVDIKGINADLSNLEISQGSLTPVFNSDVTTYEVALDYEFDEITVTPTTSDLNAVVTVNNESVLSGYASSPIQLEVGVNEIIVIVSAEFSAVTKTYNLNVTRNVRPPVAGDYTINNQADLDALEGVSTIEGSLTVETDLLLNLDGLESLATIGGYLNILRNDLLEDIQGLRNVSFVEGIKIYNNSSLSNLDGLENITTVEGDVWITSNDVLVSLNGLQNITSIGGQLRITTHISLQYLTGLNNVSVVNGDVAIEENISLLNLNGLQSLTTIGGVFSIFKNKYLYNLSGLNSLSSVYGIGVMENKYLNTLSGLDGISSIEIIYIAFNEELQSLNGLQNLTSVGIDLAILSNDSLRDISSLNNVLSVGGYLNITSNPLISNLSSLRNVESCGDVYIADNGITFVGLSSLATVDNNFIITYNNSLITLEIPLLRTVNGDFEISNNPILPTTLAEDLLNNLDYLGGVSIIENNGN